MKKILFSLLMLCSMTAVMAQGAPPQASDGYYELSTAEHLRWFAEFVNTPGADNNYPNVSANARLMNDIDLQCTAENQWTPIGKTREYNGIFDGAGKTITNLYIDSNDDNNGFIGQLRGELKDLTIKNSTFKSTGNYLGAFVGQANGDVSGCKNHAAVSGVNNVGGIAGQARYCTISNCENHGSIASTKEVVSYNSRNYIGGIIGGAVSVTMSYCVNTGEITAKTSYIGGLIGYADQCKQISNCYNTGNISSNGIYESQVGGAIGNFSLSADITNVYSTGKVTCPGSTKVGNFVGYIYSTSNLKNCFTLAENKGIFIGKVESWTPTLTDCGSMPAEMFANGELTWKLNNGSDAEPVWYQAIGRDALPTLEQSQYTVIHKDASGYYNEKELLPDPVTLADGTEYEASLSRIAADMTYTHSFDNSGAWYSYYVPFEMPVEKLTAQGVKVAYINAIHQYDMDDNGTVDRTDLEVIYAKNGIMRANFPYLVKTDEAKDVTITLSNVTLRPAESNTTKLATALADYYITGTYTGITAQEATANSYFAVGMDSEGKSALVIPSNKIPAQRWYLSIKENDSPILSGAAASAAKAFRIVVKDEEDQATGIALMQNAEFRVQNSYNLNGQRVNANHKGIIIINGKKILVK